MPSRLGLALIVVTVAFAALAPAAFASFGVNTNVVNDTDYAVSLRASSGGESCWNDDDFGDSDTVAANSSFTYYSSIKTGDDTCADSASDENAHIYLALYVEQPDGDLVNPFSTAQGNLLTSGPDYGSIGNFELFWHNTSNQYLYVYNSPATDMWTPASPVTSGATGSGLFCVSWTQSYYEGATYYPEMRIESEPDCPSTSDGPSASSASAASAPAHADSSTAHPGPKATAAQSDGGVFNLLPMLQGQCELFDLSSYCSDISDDANWNLENVTTDVTSFEADDPPPTTYAWGALDPPYLEQYNGTDQTGSLDYTFDYTEGEQDTTATTNGMTVGDQLTFGTKSGPINDQISATYNFSTTDAQATGTQSTTSVSASIPTERDGTTYLYGFQGTGTQEFNYTADLTFGDQTGNAEPLTTVAPGILGYSPAQAQPCIGYLVGDSSVSGSVMQAYAQSQSLGDSADDPNLDDYEQAFLSGGSGFNSSSSECPGFPSGFASGAGFDGSGTMDASVLGGTGVSETSWYPDLGSIVTCAYTDTPDTDPSNPDTPCQPVSSSSSYRAHAAQATEQPTTSRFAGNVMRSGDHPRRSRLVGTQRSVLMIGASNDRDTLITGPGTFNVIQGAAGGETLVARGKTDVVYGGSGRDRITGGPGYDSLYGKGGADTMSAGTGTGAVKGGTGDDAISSGPHSRSGLFGEQGNDSISVRGTRKAGVFGGPGDDIYRVFGKNATKSVVEHANRGNDTLVTDHSLHVPQNIEVGKSSGPGIRLTGKRTTRRLVGNRNDDTLIAGPGGERLVGRAGDDALQLGHAGFDTATGGRGADRFIPTAVPFVSWHSKARRHPATQQITDFAPPDGDRLVLRAKYFGRAVLSRHLTLQERPTPRATTRKPTILFDPDAKLLSFDPDGSGTQDPRLVARLLGLRCGGSSAPTSGSYGVKIVLGQHCLPPSAISVTK